VRRAVLSLVVLATCAVAAATALAAGPRPAVVLRAPGLASDAARGRTVTLRWAGVGSAPLRYRIEVRLNTLIASNWRRLEPDTTGRHAHFRGRPGATYLFRLRARDSAGRLSTYDYDRTTVPYDDRSGKIGYSRSWHSVRRRGAYGRSVHLSRRPGATVGMNFDGSQAVLVARTGPRAGRLAIAVDGRLAVRSLRRRTRDRRVIFRSRLLLPGDHRLRLRTLGGGAVNLDAVGVVQGAKAPLR
jgi:hypothetical protein